LKWHPLTCAVFSVLLASPGAFAHHSFAMFDRSQEISLQGTVKEFRFVNPHSWIYLLVKDEHGSEQVWELEGGSVSALARNGWTSKTLTPGDKITVRIFRRYDGTPAGEFHSVTTADGTRLDFTPRY
jgi:hypothetical protein